jgi:hypothetical protein
VINLFGLAIRHGLTAADLRSTMFAYPTGASDVGLRGDAAHDPSPVLARGRQPVAKNIGLSPA